MTELTNPVLATLDDPELGPVPTPTIVSWSPEDPAVVSFDFRSEFQPAGVTWAISRDLLIAALGEDNHGTAQGDGRVSVQHVGAQLMFELHGIDGVGHIKMLASAVRWVVNTSVSVIEPGSEFEALPYQIALEADLAEIFGGAA